MPPPGDLPAPANIATVCPYPIPDQRDAELSFELPNPTMPPHSAIIPGGNATYDLKKQIQLG